MDDLLNCPFCDGEARILPYWDNGKIVGYVSDCEVCNANIMRELEDDVISAWNTRVCQSM